MKIEYLIDVEHLDDKNEPCLTKEWVKLDKPPFDTLFGFFGTKKDGTYGEIIWGEGSNKHYKRGKSSSDLFAWLHDNVLLFSWGDIGIKLIESADKKEAEKMSVEIKGKFDYRWSSQGVELVISSPNLSDLTIDKILRSDLNKQLDGLFRKKVTVKIEEAEK